MFQGTFKSKLGDNDTYYLQIMAYIHDNPVRKKIVKQPQEWPYSSYLDLIGIRSDEITSHEHEQFSDLSHREIYGAFAKNREQEVKNLEKYVLI